MSKELSLAMIGSPSLTHPDPFNCPFDKLRAGLKVLEMRSRTKIYNCDLSPESGICSYR
jgi:hypothetical protein